MHCTIFSLLYWIYLRHGIYLLCCWENLSRASYQCMKVMDKEPLIQTKQALNFFFWITYLGNVFLMWYDGFDDTLQNCWTCKLIKIPWRSNYRKHFIRYTPLLVLVIFFVPTKVKLRILEFRNKLWEYWFCHDYDTLQWSLAYPSNRSDVLMEIMAVNQ